MSCSISLASAQSDIETRAAARASDPAIAEALKDLQASEGDKSGKLAKLEGLVNRYDATRKPVAGADVAEQAKGVKKNPLYADPAEGQQANWLANSMEKLRRMIEKRMPRNNPQTPNLGPAPNFAWLGSLLLVLGWTFLAALIGFFIYLLAKHVRWKATLQRRAKAILEEDEPERSLDEWLELADQHEREGRYREAVRCLYLACLLKFDEAGVARFDRGETNWEHLARIESSPNRPEGLDFRSPTQHFDRVWYGYIVRGFEDVAEFRAAYLGVKDSVTRRRAA